MLIPIAKRMKAPTKANIFYLCNLFSIFRILYEFIYDFDTNGI